MGEAKRDAAVGERSGYRADPQERGTINTK